MTNFNDINNQEQNDNNEPNPLADSWAVSSDEMPTPKPTEPPMEQMESLRQHVDLNTNEYTEKFRSAEIFAKKAKVGAVEITADGLSSGQYGGMDVRQDENGQYVIDTYVMKDGDNGRERVLENTRTITPGQWIVTNPKQQEGDYPNNYVMDAEKFKKRYEATDQPGVYRASGMARIIGNDTGNKVEIDAPWGGTQDGDENCYFATTYDPKNPDEIGSDRYILSGNDFATYGPADEVLGNK